MVYSHTGPVIGSSAPPQQSFSVPAPVVELSALPAEFPATVNSPLAWTGGDFADQLDYIHVLSKPELQELETALEGFRSTSSW